MGSVYKGFDDSLAGWGKGRKIDQNCGRAWLGTFSILNHFYNGKHPLPALIVVTWNDWEEGTEIESGINNCVTIKANVDGGRLTWKVDGPQETLDHYEVFASTDGTNLERISQIPLKERDLELKNAKLPPGKYTLYVKAVAKASLLNHMSGPVEIEIGNPK
jgi:hypothetical protein